MFYCFKFKTINSFYYLIKTFLKNSETCKFIYNISKYLKYYEVNKAEAHFVCIMAA